MSSHKSLIGAVYDQAAVHYGEKGCAFFDYFGQKLVEFVNPNNNHSILDVATGKGAVLIPAAKLVKKAVGIDISSQMLSELNKRGSFEIYQIDGFISFFFCKRFSLLSRKSCYG